MNQIARGAEPFRQDVQRRERRLGTTGTSAPPIAGIVIAVVLAAAGGLALAVRASRKRRFLRRVRSFTRRYLAA